MGTMWKEQMLPMMKPLIVAQRLITHQEISWDMINYKKLSCLIANSVDSWFVTGMFMIISKGS